MPVSYLTSENKTEENGDCKLTVAKQILFREGQGWQDAAGKTFKQKSNALNYRNFLTNSH